MSLRRPSPHAPPLLVRCSVLLATRPDHGHSFDGPDAGDQPYQQVASTVYYLVLQSVGKMDLASPISHLDSG
ncbi:hypothetical protein BDA96_02G303000 [Sorghum bicolor]|uniref:Uncharacterized protein n=2 Tax=Sorghum bicolor TaxID=4558 RepID=A0A921RS81_SORBI|nr:hypothetical protein BDA96_02G303000 [Sorghum bicolor]KXG36127.1 hypothetical protein SORBI_3002G287900 [Sorghum bicolor]